MMEALRLRPAGADDAELLLALRNDPVSVAFSKTGRAVSSDEHSRWMAAWLDRPGTRIWIGEVEGRAVGQIRVDADDGIGTISVAVAPEHRGHGYAKDLIGQVIATLRSDHQVRQLQAAVHNENAASMAAFRANQFVRSGTEDAFEILVFD